MMKMEMGKVTVFVRILGRKMDLLMDEAEKVGTYPSDFHWDSPFVIRAFLEVAAKVLMP
jgi:hypothetical protein